jgi:hypothetical protein
VGLLPQQRLIGGEAVIDPPEITVIETRGGLERDGPLNALPSLPEEMPALDQGHPAREALIKKRLAPGKTFDAGGLLNLQNLLYDAESATGLTTGISQRSETYRELFEGTQQQPPDNADQQKISQSIRHPHEPILSPLSLFPT